MSADTHRETYGMSELEAAAAALLQACEQRESHLADHDEYCKHLLPELEEATERVRAALAPRQQHVPPTSEEQE